METATPTPIEKPKNVPLQWSALMHPEHERTSRWYVAAGLCALALIAYAIWTAAWSFVVVIVMIAIAYVWLRSTPPAMGTIRIDEDGVTWHGKLLPWDSLKDFWIVRLPGYTELHMARKRVGGEIIIQTGNIPSPELIATLSQFLEQRQDQGERLIDKIIRLAKL